MIIMLKTGTILVLLHATTLLKCSKIGDLTDSEYARDLFTLPEYSLRVFVSFTLDLPAGAEEVDEDTLGKRFFKEGNFIICLL